MSLLYELEEDGSGYFCYEETDKTITEMIIPDEYNALPVVRVGDWICAEGFSNLEKVIIGNNVKSVGQDAFNTPSVKKIVYGSGIQTIVGGFNQTRLTDVYYSGNENEWNDINFTGIDFEKLRSAKIHYGVLTESAYIVDKEKIISPITSWDSVRGKPNFDKMVNSVSSFPNEPEKGDCVILPCDIAVNVKSVEINKNYANSIYKSYRPLQSFSFNISPARVNFPATLESICGYNIMRPACDRYISVLFCPPEFDEEENVYLIDKVYLKVLQYNATQLESIICYVSNNTKMFSNTYEAGWYNVNPETAVVSKIEDEEELPSFLGGYIIDVNSTDSEEFIAMYDFMKDLTDKFLNIEASKGVYCYDGNHWNGIDWDRTIWGV